MFNILVVEDNEDLLELTCIFLRKKGYNTIPAKNGLEALDKLDTSFIDCCVVDLMMPEMNGEEFIKTIREENYSTPVIAVTAKSRFEDIEETFSIGADDYMIKPINFDELNIRIKALMRRSKITNDKKIEIGNTILNYDSLTISQNGEETLLPQKEFLLLYKLLSYPNKIFTRQQLIDEIWGYDNESDERTVNVHINRIREKTKENTDFQIITIRGLGYKAVKIDEK